MTHPTWSNDELYKLFKLAVDRCGHVPLSKGWHRKQRELQAVFALIAELYAHAEHKSNRRVTIAYTSNNWQVCMNTGGSKEVYYTERVDSIYNLSDIMEIMQRFVKLCEQEHNKLFPQEQTPEEELRDRLAAAAIPNLPHILRDYEIKRKDRAQ